MADLLSPMQKRLQFQASRRSTREMEQLLQVFLEKKLSQLDDRDCMALLNLLDWPDLQLYDWITGLHPAPHEVDGAWLQRLRTA